MLLTKSAELQCSLHNLLGAITQHRSFSLPQQRPPPLPPPQPSNAETNENQFKKKKEFKNEEIQNKT
jgi:hypothetical protein